MKHSFLYRSLFLALLSSSFCVDATVAPINPGEGLWPIISRIGTDTDLVQLQISQIELQASTIDITASTLDTVLVDTISSIEQLATDANEISSLVDSAASIVEDIADRLPCTFYINNAGINGGGSFNITSPGHYCVLENITNTLTIASESVLLDLNGFNIAGSTDAIIIGTVADVTIKNGSIVGSVGRGIFATDVKDLAIIDVNFNNPGVVSLFGADLSLHGCYNVVIERCNFSGSKIGDSSIFLISSGSARSNSIFLSKLNLFDLVASQGIFIVDGTNVHAKNISVASSNLASAIAILGGTSAGISNCLFEDCIVSNVAHVSTCAAFEIQGFTNNCMFSRCIAEDIGAPTPGAFGIGFSVRGSIGIVPINTVFEHCIASNIGDGGAFGGVGFFSSLGGTTVFQNCVARGCVGGSTGIGFTVTGTLSQALIKNCYAANNSTYGFSRAGGALDPLLDSFLGNVAHDNASADYSITSAGAISLITLSRATGTFSSTPTIYDNISVI